MRGHLWPYFQKNSFNRRLRIHIRIERMIIEQKMYLKFFSPINHLIHKIKKQRINHVIWRTIGHEMQINRQTDNIAT